MYTEVELKAMDSADEAFAEVKKVAESFAKQIGHDYCRRVTCWSSYSTFVKPFLKPAIWHRVSPEKMTASVDNSEAIDCAWELADCWNSKIPGLYTKYIGYRRLASRAKYDENAEYYDNQASLCVDAYDKILEECGEIVERWIDSACDFAYESYLAEHSA